MTTHKRRELSSHVPTHQERHTHPRHIYDSKGFLNTNPHIKRGISLLTTYMQEDKGSLRYYQSRSRLTASPNNLP